jgi:hypothetical protein
VCRELHPFQPQPHHPPSSITLDTWPTPGACIAASPTHQRAIRHVCDARFPLKQRFCLGCRHRHVGGVTLCCGWCWGACERGVDWLLGRAIKTCSRQFKWEHVVEDPRANRARSIGTWRKTTLHIQYLCICLMSLQAECHCTCCKSRYDNTPLQSRSSPMLVLALLKQRVPFGSAPHTPALPSKLQQFSIGFVAYAAGTGPVNAL